MDAYANSHKQNRDFRSMLSGPVSGMAGSTAQTVLVLCGFFQILGSASLGVLGLDIGRPSVWRERWLLAIGNPRGREIQFFKPTLVERF